MAINKDISGLNNKIPDDGSPQGRLTHEDWNNLVDAVIEVQNKVEGSMKGIIYKGGEKEGGQTFNKIDERGYLIMDVVDPQGTLTVYTDKKPNAFIAVGAPCEVEFHVTSKIDDSGQSVTSTTPCTVRYYIGTESADGVVNYTQVGTDSIYDVSYTIQSESKRYCKFDFSKVTNVPLATGDITNYLKVEVSNGYGLTKPVIMTVNVVDMSISVDDFNMTKVFVDSPSLTVQMFGSDANVYAKVDDTMILNGVEVKKGEKKPFGTKPFVDNNVNTHGVHTLKIWASVTKDIGLEGEQLVISTDPLEYTYIYGTTNSRPIVMANVKNNTPEEYTMLNLEYVAYKYSSTSIDEKGTIDVIVYEIDDNGNPIKTDPKNPNVDWALIRKPQTVTFDAITKSVTGTVSLSMFPVQRLKSGTVTNEYESVSLVGNRAVVISIGDFEYIEYITVTPSSIRLNETTNWAVKLSSSGRDNSSPTRNQWVSEQGIDVEGNPLVVDFEFEPEMEFSNAGSGWNMDGNDNIALHLKKGRKGTLNFTPFNTNPTWNDNQDNYGTGKGMTISFEFATRNCLNQNTPVITCMDYTNSNGIGFEVTANKATLTANNASVFADFREDTRIKLDMVIEGSRTAYTYKTTWTEDGGQGETKEKEATEYEAYAIIYVDGVYQGLAYLDTGVSFYQNNPQKIVFGSDDCDLDLYSIRIYNTALTMDQIINNYAFDTPVLEEKLAIAKRNQDVLVSRPNLGNMPDINITALRAARPELPFFYVEMDTEQQEEVLPKDKNFWKLMKTTQYKNPMNTDDLGEGNTSFEVIDGAMKNQGTSSMSYPWPWRNWDWKTKDSDLYRVGDGNFYMPTYENYVHKESKWPQYKGMGNAGNIKKITLKKDYASSEMCNNAITSRYFTDMALAIGGARPNVLSPAQRQLGAAATPFKLALIATPCFMFHTFSDKNKSGSAGKGVDAMGMMNLIPNKNECDYLGFGKVSGYAWGSKDGSKFDRAQSWELKDNFNDWFWCKELEGFKKDPTASDGFVNDVKKLYEARYPKDSTVDFGGVEADFGMTPKGFSNPDENTADAIYDEQRDIIAFHNWLVSCNRQLCLDYKNEHGDYRTLNDNEKTVSWNINEKTKEYIDTKDTPNYRLNKFAAEAEDHLIIDQFCLYYIWREMFWAYDSGLKNLQVYTMGPNPNGNRPDIYQWGCMVRDADTTMGIQNQGRIEFPAHLEDTDYMKVTEEITPYGKVSKKEFFYDALVPGNELDGWYTSDNISTIFKGEEILHGQLACLWVNLRDAFSTKIADLYRLLYQNSIAADWTSGRAIKKFRDHQEKWCESLYNFGMRQYIGGTPFRAWLGSGLGDKKNSRAAWIEKKFYYLNTKYKCLSVGEYVAFRGECYETNDLATGNTEGESLDVKVYMPIYLGLNASTQDMSECKKFIRITDIDNPISIPINENGFGIPKVYTGNVNWFYGTSQITELGDLARVCKIHEFQDVNFPKLRELNLGHEKERTTLNGKPCEPKEYTEIELVNGVKKSVPFNNSYLKDIKPATMTSLQVLDVTNHTALENLTLSDCMQLRELYARGCTNINTITLPVTSTITTLYYPNTIQKINLENLTGLTKFVLESPTVLEDGTKIEYNIDRLNINNCGSYMAKRSYDIFMAVVSSLEKKFKPGATNMCILKGIDWDITDQNGYKTVERLLNLNAKVEGHIKIKSLPNDLKVKLVNEWGPIDDKDHTIWIEYDAEEITEITLPSKIYVYEPGETQLEFTVSPESANTYDYAVWELSDNSYATMSPLKAGVIVRNSTPCENINDKATLTVTVYQRPYDDGSPRPVKTATCDVYFYERLAKPGDIVFSDGTFSDELISGKVPVGVCFYVDNKYVPNPDDPNDGPRRLMVALESIQMNSTLIEWGLGDGGENPDGSGGVASYYGSPQGIKIGNTNYNCYSLNTLIPFNQGGPTEGDTDTIYFTDDIYRDGTNVVGGYFKEYLKSTLYGDIGWKTIENEIKVDGLKDKDGNTMILSLNSGDRVPSGYYNTLAIMQHRNKVLDAYRDSDNGLFVRPYTSEDYSEIEILERLIQKADFADIEDRDSKGGTRKTFGSHLYYPAASACFSYQPNVTNLDDKFKKYNWFLPAAGDLVRLCYYAYQSYKDGKPTDAPVNSKYGKSYNEPANAFSNAIKLGVLKMNYLYGGTLNSSYTMYCSNQGSNGKQTFYINSATGKWTGTSKGNGNYVRPICRF